MKNLPIGINAHARTFNLPIEIVTQKTAFLGVTGSGKTYGCTKMAELMLEAGAQIVALDPVGVWRGLRMGANFPIYIFGGLSGDFPLEPTGGALVADLIVDRGISVVLDVSQFEHDTDKTRFATAFADRFFFRKKSKRSPVHLFMEECEEFVPQNPAKGEEKMLQAFRRLWKLGRNFGIGGSLISQRPQDVNKKALNQTGTLFVFQMTGPQERKAIEGWCSDVGVNAPDLGKMLPNIEVGKPHVWSPTFLKVSEPITIGLKITADVSSTPTMGEHSDAQVNPLSEVDGISLREAMAATVERAKDNDPDALKQKVRNLEAELRKKPAAAPAPPPVVERVEVPILSPDELATVRSLLDRVGSIGLEMKGFYDRGTTILAAMNTRQDNAGMSLLVPTKPATALKHLVVFKPPHVPARTGNPGISVGLTEPQQKIIDVIAMLGVRGIEANRDSVARWLSVHPNGGSYGANLAFLRSEGYLEGCRLTPKGEQTARPMETGFQASLEPLEIPQRTIMRKLQEIGRVTREELADALGVHPNGGSYGGNLSRLRTMGLITARGPIELTEGAAR